MTATIQNPISLRTTKTLLMVALAYVTFFGAVFLSVNAQAAIRAPGTFVPSACGQPVQAAHEPIISEVCIGQITGEAAKSDLAAFEFRDENGAAAVYRVTEVANMMSKLLQGGVRANVFMVGPNGDEVTVKLNRMPNGSYKQASGKIGEADFEVPEFSPVFVTM